MTPRLPPRLTHRRVIRWRSLATALVQVAGSGTVAVVWGPKAGAVVGMLGILVQSQMKRVIDKELAEPIGKPSAAPPIVPPRYSPIPGREPVEPRSPPPPASPAPPADGNIG